MLFTSYSRVLLEDSQGDVSTAISPPLPEIALLLRRMWDACIPSGAVTVVCENLAFGLWHVEITNILNTVRDDPHEVALRHTKRLLVAGKRSNANIGRGSKQASHSPHTKMHPCASPNHDHTRSARSLRGA